MAAQAAIRNLNAKRKHTEVWKKMGRILRKHIRKWKEIAGIKIRKAMVKKGERTSPGDEG